ncbi:MULTISPECIES: hypothetical protein [Novosphingobium]|uniref:hypothetical protein n=1 Tax=Novosphingobium TaxID=165696 RepID=UPI0011AB696F|nr:MULTISPECIES: hypothetical protein [Novosphingobium]
MGFPLPPELLIRADVVSRSRISKGRMRRRAIRGPGWRLAGNGGQKKARQLPAGPGSFGRGCLKGSFCMHHAMDLCNCEINRIGCAFCNPLIKILI